MPALNPRIAIVLLLLAVAIANRAAGQNTVGRFVLRQQLRNDAYLIERATQRPRHPAPPAATTTGRVVQASATIERAPVDRTAATVLNYFGNRRAIATLQQAPASRINRAPTSPSNGSAPPAPAAAEPRPFEGAEPRGTVSPYLGLFRESFDEDAPNYYTFVRPQLEQQRQNQRQQLTIERLNRERSARRNEAANSVTSESTANRFGNTGQFYGGWER